MSINLRIGIGRKASLMSPGEIAIRDGNTYVWYALLEEATITKDGTGKVTQYVDKLGGGCDQTTLVGAEPYWEAAEGIKYNELPAYSRYTQSGAFAIPQPFTVYILLKQTEWTHPKWIFDDTAPFICYFGQYGVTPDLRIFAGGATNIVISGLNIGTWGLLTLIFDGANSSMQLNNGIPAVGDIGVAGLTRLWLGCDFLSANGARFNTKEIVFRKIHDTDATKLAIQSFINSKHSIY